MSIFSRLTDIINSNVNAILDKAEDPEKIVRLMIQEMEDTLVEARSGAARTIAETKELGRQRERLTAQIDEWQRKAELALEKDREDLAKAALVAKAKLVETRDQLDEDMARIDEDLAKASDDIAKLQEKLDHAKSRQKAMTMRTKTAGNRLKVRVELHNRKVDDVIDRFDYMERKLDEVNGQVEAYDLGGERKKSLAEEFGDLEVESKVEAELEALKAKAVKAKSAKKPAKS